MWCTWPKPTFASAGALVKVFMVKDPDGNSIALAQAPDDAASK